MQPRQRLTKEEKCNYFISTRFLLEFVQNVAMSVTETMFPGFTGIDPNVVGLTIQFSTRQDQAKVLNPFS